MTYEEKIEQSEILKVVGPKSYKRAGIQTAKGRLISIIFLIFTSLYTIFTKILLKDSSFDIQTLCIIINILSLVGIKFLDKSLLIKNKTNVITYYHILIFINKICKVVIFGFSLYSTYKVLEVIKIEEYGCNPVILLIRVLFQDLSYKVLLKLPFDIQLKLLTTVISLILTIPSIILLLIYIIKIAYIILLPLYLLSPLWNFILLFKLIKSYKKRKIFKNYIIENDQVYIEYRQMNYSKAYIIRNAILVLLYIAFLVIYYLTLYRIFTNEKLLIDFYNAFTNIIINIIR